MLHDRNASILRDQVYFIDIGRKSGSLFHWNSTGKSAFTYQLQITAEHQVQRPEIPVFVHTLKKDMKVVSWEREGLIIVVGASVDLQYQVIEAVIEYIINEFLDLYGSLLDTYVNGQGVLFNGFKQIVEEGFETIWKEQIKQLLVQCPGCGQRAIRVYVRKSLIESAASYPVALVYQHGTHALLIYIDANYDVRGAEIVNITG